MSKEYTIDASGKVLGRLATEIAILLRGKNSASYLPSRTPENVVRIKNISKIVLTGKKTKQKTYIHHTRHAKGLRERSYAQQIKKDPARALRFAVLGMLPKNRQRAKLIKNLIVS